MDATESLDALRLLVGTPSGSEVQVYWLLDQSGMPQQGWLQRLIGNAEWCDLLDGASQTSLNGASPILVRANSRSRAIDVHMANQLHRVNRFANSISFILSPLGIDELRSLMAQRARIDLPGNLEAVLRYFDTRTLPLLPRLLSPEQYATFMQGIERWLYLDRHGVLQCMPCAEDSGTDSMPTRLQLNEAQEAQLIDDGLTDSVIDFLLTQGHPALRGQSPPEQFAVIEPLVDASRACGLGDALQAKAFVCAALAEGVDFTEREPWKQRLTAYRQQRCTIEEVFS